MAAKFPNFFPTRWFSLINGLTLNNLFNTPLTSYEDGITAKAGGVQANAYQLSAVKSRVSVCATNADSVKLPKSKLNVGGEFLVINDGAANLAVFPFDTATIDGGAASASVTVGNGKRTLFWCTKDGNWSSGGMSVSA